MMPPFERVVEEFEKLTHESGCYFEFQNADGLSVCVRFRKGESRPWSLWLKGSEETSRQTISRNYLEPVIEAFLFSPAMLSEQLAEQLLLEAAWADEFIRQIGSLFGPEAIQKAILGTQNFMNDLNKALEMVFANKSEQGKDIRVKQPSGRPELRVLKGNGENKS